MSVHDLFDWLLGRGQYQPQESVQDTGAYQLPDLLGKVAGGKRWNGPVGTWASVYRNEPPHRKRDNTPIPPVQETGSMCRIQATDPIRRLARGRLVPIDYDPLLPIQRQQAANNAADLDDMMRQSFADLPAWLAPATFDRRIEELLAQSEPLADNSWLTAEPPVLHPLDEDALASADKVASNPLGVTVEDCAPAMDDPAPTEEGPRVRFEKIIKQIKESEG